MQRGEGPHGAKSEMVDSAGAGGLLARPEGRTEMGNLIATMQATVDGVIDPVGEWVQADGDHGDYSFERQARSGGLLLGRKTYEGLAGYWPSQSGEMGPDMVGNATLRKVQGDHPAGAR